MEIIEMKKLLKTMAIVPALALSSVAFAAEPVQLDATQMDEVAAGGIAFADAIAAAIGRVTATSTSALADTRVVATFTSEVTTIRNVASTSAAASASSAL
jgi:hypothetical protein